jgi:large subunit ribosomal protein L19
MHGLAKYVEMVEKEQLKTNLPELKIGMTLKVGVTVVESGKSRVQPYQGLLIAMHKNGLNSTITVRKVFQGIGVERVFPIHSPLVTIDQVPTAGVPRVRTRFRRTPMPAKFSHAQIRSRAFIVRVQQARACFAFTCPATSPTSLKSPAAHWPHV